MSDEAQPITLRIERRAAATLQLNRLEWGGFIQSLDPNVDPDDVPAVSLMLEALYQGGSRKLSDAIDNLLISAPASGVGAQSHVLKFTNPYRLAR